MFILQFIFQYSLFLNILYNFFDYACLVSIYSTALYSSINNVPQSFAVFPDISRCTATQLSVPAAHSRTVPSNRFVEAEMLVAPLR